MGRFNFALAAASLALAGCNQSPSGPPEAARNPEPMVTVTLPQPAPEPRRPPTDEELKACAAGPDLEGARSQAADDVARREWRYSTFVSGGIAYMTTAPGVKNCQPVLVQGHDRHRQLGVCGDVAGGPFDCACADAEEKWRAAYNQEITRLVKGAFERNCVPEDRAINCASGPAGECEELALARVQRQFAQPPKLTLPQ